MELLGDRKTPRNLEELLKKAAEDPAFKEAFGEKAEKKPEEVKEIKQDNVENIVEDSYKKKIDLVELTEVGISNRKCGIRGISFINYSPRTYMGVGFGTGQVSVFREDYEPYASMNFKKEIRAIANCRDTGHIAFGGKDRRVRIYHLGEFPLKAAGIISRKPDVTVKFPSRVNDVAFGHHESNNLDLLAVGGGVHGKGFVGIYETYPYKKILKEIKVFQRPGMVSAVEFSPDDKELFVGGNDIEIYSTADLNKTPRKRMSNNWVFSLAFSNDGKYVVIGNHDSFEVCRVYPAFWYPEIGYGCSPYTIHGISFSPDDKYLAVCGGEPHKTTKEGKGGFVKVFEFRRS